MSAPAVLVLAGLDPSGGAGLLADAETVRALGAHPLCVATALTVQTMRAARRFQPVDPSLIADAMRALLEEEDVRAIKVGMVGDAANARQPVPFTFDLTYDQPGHPLQYYCRADHYSYARYGIPSVAFSRGEHLDYHQVTDEAQYISYPDLARVAQMVHDGALAVANAPQRPKRDVPKPADPHGPCVQ